MNMYGKYADLFYGNGETDRFIKDGVASKWFYIKALCGNTLPHAVLPFGKISVGAYSGGYPGGYGTHCPNSCMGIKKFDDIHKIRGFSHLHQSGTGAIRYYYNYAIVSPFYGDVENAFKYYPLEKESAVPGYYEAEFNNILCKMTVNANTALHRYIFKKNNSRLCIDFSNDGLCKDFGNEYFAEVTKNNFIIMPDGKVCFDGIFSGIRLYFAVEVKNSIVSLDEDKMCAVFDFEGNEVLLKISYSTISYVKAANNIDAAGEFEKTASDAYKIWNDHLSAIDVETDNEELKKKFYSNFYHSLIKPVDMTGENVLGISGNLVCDIATFWDQYKTLFPLILLLYPQMGKKISDTIINISRTFNKMPCSLGISDIFPCEEQAKMLGIYTLLDAFYAGLCDKSDIDECIKRELEREDFLKFINNGVFERYTHIIDVTDACRYVADITDDSELSDMLLTLSKNWKNAFDKDGLLSENSLYYEGDRYTYSFRPHSNMNERINLCGSTETFIKMLDDFFGFNGKSLKQITEIDAWDKLVAAQHHRFEGFNNECDMETPYSYIYANRHDRLCEIIHACITDSFGLGIGALPGNNDSGGLSSCFIWNSLGIFPISGSGYFLLGSPHFKHTTIRLANNKILEIEAVNLTAENYFVEKILFNDTKIKDYKLPVSSILNGGRLIFFMKPR